MKTPDQHNDLFASPAAASETGNEIRLRAEDVAVDPPQANRGCAGEFGRRLAAARAARGMRLQECSQSLRLPMRVLQRLEAGDFGDAGQQVFVRGALRNYARLLGMPAATVDSAVAEAAPPPQPVLAPTGNVPRQRWVLRRYGAAATYVVLTATVAVPLAWLGLRGGLDRQIAQIAPLDNAPAASSANHIAVVNTAAAPQANESPLLASMTPFSAMDLDTAAPTPAPTASPLGKDHVLELRASADSWIEVIDARGNKLESGILRAGERRSYRSVLPLDLTVGNADAVTVSRDGTPISLKPRQHAKVARLRVFGDPGDAGGNQ